MIDELKYYFIICVLFMGSVQSSELNWEVGLTSNRNLITAKGSVTSSNAETILYLAGLDGPSQATLALDTLSEEYSLNSMESAAVSYTHLTLPTILLV